MSMQYNCIIMNLLVTRKWLSRWSFSALGSFILLTLQGCNVGPKSDQKILKLGVSADYPPFEFKQNGRIVGFDVDLAEELAKELGYTVEIQDMDFSALIPSLKTGRVDFVMSGISVNEERKKNVRFGDPYYSGKFAVVSKSDTS